MSLIITTSLMYPYWLYTLSSFIPVCPQVRGVTGPVLAVQLFKSKLLCKHKRFVPAQLNKRLGVILWLSASISINVAWKHHLHGEICAVFCRLLSLLFSWGPGSLPCHILMSTNKTSSRIKHDELEMRIDQARIQCCVYQQNNCTVKMLRQIQWIGEGGIKYIM